MHSECINPVKIWICIYPFSLFGTFKRGVIYHFILRLNMVRTSQFTFTYRFISRLACILSPWLSTANAVKSFYVILRWILNITNTIGEFGHTLPSASSFNIVIGQEIHVCPQNVRCKFHYHSLPSPATADDLIFLCESHALGNGAVYECD